MEFQKKLEDTVDLSSSFRFECKELAAQEEGSCCEKLKQLKKTTQGVKNKVSHSSR